ncbi:MAG: peptidoglycan binding protein CsiV [Marinobacterium sp.]|nr:peptidoglycan binding protein CsiV [Marinobacterium sp.]
MKALTKLMITACLLVLLPASQAWSVSWYQVEVLIFANNDPDALDDEFWPTGLSVPEKPNAIPLASTNSHKAYSRLPGSSLLFTSEKRRIEQYENFRVLFHGGWKQPVVSKRNAKPVYIRAGQELSNGKYELEGYITIDRGRFLHFRPDLFHSRQLDNREQNILNAFEQQEVTHTDQGAARMDFLTVQMSQGRRMRSKEVHYIDHPLMGILVLMLPLKQQIPSQ